MKLPRRIRLDFVTPARGTPRVGAALCAAGVAAALAVGLAFDVKLSERNRLDAALGVISQPRAVPSAAATRAAEEIATVERELTVPWSPLLAELESASHDSADKIAVLAVEPDAAKRVVKVTAEARTLSDALGYLERLQKSAVLRYPMLESHERRKDDPQHPIRVKLAAEWRS